jgi:hypothetical protein
MELCFVFGCFTTLYKIMAPHVTHISSDGFLKVFLPLFSFNLPCGVSATQHCLTLHTVHLPRRLRLIGNACCCCVIHCGHFPTCQNKWCPYSVDCLSELKSFSICRTPFRFLRPFCPVHTTKYFLCFILLELYSLFLYATLTHNISLKLSGFRRLTDS